MARSIARIITGIAASDGAGVRLKRILGSPELDNLDPFLLLDEFKNDNPDDYIAGFPPHPHRGFETVTYMLRGKMRHEDSVGNSGLLSDGAVQWMTAGRGIIHSEMPEQTDGLLWGYQLWVNLPARLKMTPAGYQDIPADRIPEVSADGGIVRVIAGAFQGVVGAAETLTPVTYLDAHLAAGRRITLPLADDFNALVYVYEGAIDGADPLGRERPVAAGRMAVLSRQGDVEVAAGPDGARCLVIAGAALDEPIARMGPFVMNTRAELTQAVEDYRGGTLTG
jgi:redox-sensitive bicupin YhaK (pirin superfamily)